MKVPSWFIVGCGLLVLNLTLVLGSTLSRHALAEPPDDRLAQPAAAKNTEGAPVNAPAMLAEPAPSILAADSVALESVANEPVDNEPVDNEPQKGAPPARLLPDVPSLDSDAPSPSVIHMDDFKPFLSSMPTSSDLLAPLDEMLEDAPERISEQLSHSFFEGMKRRLQTAEHLNQSALGLVEEAAILYQRGEIEKAQELLGMAAQIREMTARLLVTRQ